MAMGPVTLKEFLALLNVNSETCSMQGCYCTDLDNAWFLGPDPKIIHWLCGPHLDLCNRLISKTYCSIRGTNL